MGTFWYAADEHGLTVDDRALAHLQQVIVTKLRRGEHFFFHGDGAAAPASGGYWMSPAVSMRFDYLEREPSDLNVRWVEMLAREANSAMGLRIIPEPVAVTTRVPARRRQQRARLRY